MIYDLRAIADALNDEVTRPDEDTPADLDGVFDHDDLIRLAVAALYEAAS